MNATAAIASAMREGYDKLISFSQDPAFRAMVLEMYDKPREERPKFVREVVLSEEARAERGIVLPDGILVQRSTFGDRRPTLFCIKIYLPEELHAPWQNVNLTFDDLYDDRDVPRDERAWRPGLPFDEQASLMAQGVAAADMVDL
ncbi:MAG TPA: hypothetical protein VFZ91_13775 [Allosphingosinicella sp.]